MSAPLTTAKLGSTRCVGCEKRFTDTPEEPVVETIAAVENNGRVDSTGSRHRGIGTHQVTRLWHTACLEDFERSNQEYRAQVHADQEQMLRDLAEAAGMDPDEVVAEARNRRQKAGV